VHAHQAAVAGLAEGFERNQFLRCAERQLGLAVLLPDVGEVRQRAQEDAVRPCPLAVDPSGACSC
jgi:hypothetical protein